MTILYITAFPPCQKTAGQDYSRRLLDDLALRGHKLSLIYAEYPEHELEFSSQINSCKNKADSKKLLFTAIF